MAATTHQSVVLDHSSRMKRIEDCQDEHDKFINGNGSPGAKARLALLEDSVERIETSMSRMTNWFIGLIITIGGSVAIWFLTQQLPKLAALK
jgi:ABC-type siderophore export system fused ATPase/permease subunit